MKILVLDGFFDLPEDFSGGISDALRLLADYHQNPLTEANRIIDPSPIPVDSKKWTKFLESRKDGFKVLMGMSVQRLIGNKWEIMGR